MSDGEYGSASPEADQGLSEDEDDEDDGDGDGQKSDEEEDDETTEMKTKIRQLTGEIKALEGAVEKKRAGFTGGSNPIMKVSAGS